LGSGAEAPTAAVLLGALIVGAEALAPTVLLGALIVGAEALAPAVLLGVLTIGPEVPALPEAFVARPTDWAVALLLPVMPLDAWAGRLFPEGPEIVAGAGVEAETLLTAGVELAAALPTGWTLATGALSCWAAAVTLVAAGTAARALGAAPEELALNDGLLGAEDGPATGAVTTFEPPTPPGAWAGELSGTLRMGVQPEEPAPLPAPGSTPVGLFFCRFGIGSGTTTPGGWLPAAAPPVPVPSGLGGD
jgi:hypothetical protein